MGRRVTKAKKKPKSKTKQATDKMETTKVVGAWFDER